MGAKRNENVQKELLDQSDRQIEMFELDDTSEAYRCGYGGCTPEPLQYLHNAKFLVLCLSLIGTCLGMVVNGLVPISITTLEKRFDLSSTDSGSFAGAYKLASMMTMLPVAYFSGRGHKGRYLGLGALSLSAGSAVICMSQFMSKPYDYGRGVFTQGNDSDSGYVCRQNESGVNVNMLQEDIEPVARTWYYLLILGQLLHGCGGAPIVLLAVTFIDDNVSQMASPVYSSIFMACRNIVGPAVGYIFGGFALKVYGDFLTVDMNHLPLSGPSDSRWYGAWWIGFVLSSVVSALLAIPILGFARRLPEATRHRAKDDIQSQKKTQDSTEDPETDFSRATRIIMKLLRNPTFTCVVLTQATEAFMVSGLITFSPKIIESVFDYSSSASSLVSGAILLGGGLGGTILGGYLIRRWRLKCTGIIRLAMISALLCAPCYFLFMIRCEQLPFAGQSTVYYGQAPDMPLSVIGECNENCQCANIYQPMCHESTKTTFYSPCHAGCTTFSLIHGHSDCSCVAPLDNSTLSSLSPGRCKQNCAYFVVFCVAYSAFALATFTSNIPLQQTVLRSVEFSHRTLAMGLHFLVDGFATLFGAVAFGAAFDSLCVVWMSNDDDTKKNCVRYDSDLMGPLVIVFGLGMKVTGIILLYVASRFYSPPVDDGHLANGDSVQYSPDGDDRDKDNKHNHELCLGD